MQASKATPTAMTSREKGLRREQHKTVLQSLFEHTAHQLACRRSRQRWGCQTCKQSVGETSLVRWLRAGPCSAQIQAMQSFGNSLGMEVTQVRAGACVPVGWKIVRPLYSVAQYRGITWCFQFCGVDFAITVQVRHAMFGRDQDFGTGCVESSQTRISSTRRYVLASTSD